MIVRKLEDSFLLIRQHEHGQISGEFARYWGVQKNPQRPTLFAITNHDVGWQELDDEVRFNPQTGEPYSFIDYPLEPKLQAYKHGLDRVEAQEPYASYLCSLHYTSFVRDSSEPAAINFKEHEASRRTGIEERAPREWLENTEYNFRLLQLCDDLSFFVCLNEPGENNVSWYKDGFDFMGQKIRPVWRDRQTLSLTPNPLSDSFDFTIPYEKIGSAGQTIEHNGFYIRVVR